MANLFSIILVLTAIVLVVGTSIAIVAPNFGVSVPPLPGWPSFASNLDWTVTLTNWSGIGSFFLFVGGIFFYIASFIVFAVAMVGVTFTLLGVVPWIANGVSALVFLAFVGSLLMFIRGSGDGMSGGK